MTQHNPTFTPICPECGVDGRRVRKVRGKNQCLECRHRWTENGGETDQ